MFSCYTAQIEIQVHINNTVVALWIQQHRYTTKFSFFRFTWFRVAFDILQQQLRQCCLLLRCVFRRLPFIQNPVLFNQILNFLSPGSTGFFQTFGFRFLTLCGKFLIRYRHDHGQCIFIQESFLQKFFKITGVCFLPQFFIQMTAGKIQCRIPAVVPGTVCGRCQHDAGRLLPFPIEEFHLVQDRLQLICPKSVFYQFLDRFTDTGTNLVFLFRIGITYYQQKIRLVQFIHDFQFHILPKLTGQNGFLERRIIITGQYGRQYTPCQLFFHIVIGT